MKEAFDCGYAFLVRNADVSVPLLVWVLTTGMTLVARRGWMEFLNDDMTKIGAELCLVSIAIVIHASLSTSAVNTPPGKWIFLYSIVIFFFFLAFELFRYLERNRTQGWLARSILVVVAHFIGVLSITATTIVTGEV